MFELEAVPHNCNPYVQPGFRMQVCSSSLLSIDSLEIRSRRQYSFVSLMPKHFRLLKMCDFNVRHLSMCIPKYLLVSAWGSGMLLSLTARRVFLRVVNVTWTDFFSFGLIFHFFIQFAMLSSPLCRFVVAFMGSLSIERFVVSSANVPIIILFVEGKSAVKRRYSNGSNTLPCGTPADISYSELTSSSSCLT